MEKNSDLYEDPRYQRAMLSNDDSGVRFSGSSQRITFDERQMFDSIGIYEGMKDRYLPSYDKFEIPENSKLELWTRPTVPFKLECEAEGKSR